MYRPVSRVWLICIVAAVACSDATGLLPRAGSERPTCATCRITRSTVAVLDHTAEPMHTGPPSAVAATRRGTWIVVGGGQAVELNADGTRRGTLSIDADGQAVEPSAMAAFGADSLLIVSEARGTIAVFGPARSMADIARVPANVRIRNLAVMQWPDRLVFSGSALGRDDIFMARIEDGFLIVDRDFPPAAARAQPRSGARVFAAGDVLWIGERNSYRLIGVDAAGRVVRDRTGSPKWFGVTRGRPRGRMRASLHGVLQAPNGRIWTYSRRPTAHAARVWRSPEARMPGGVVTDGVETLYDTVVEVLDDEARKVVARGSIAAYLVSVLPDGRAALYTRGSDGTPRLTVERLRLHDDAAREGSVAQ